MQAYNGGETVEPLFKAMLGNKENTLVLNELLGITGNDCDLEWTNEVWSDGIPAGFFAIGVDLGGNGFLIGLFGTEFEGIFGFMTYMLKILWTESFGWQIVLTSLLKDCMTNPNDYKLNEKARKSFDTKQRCKITQ